MRRVGASFSYLCRRFYNLKVNYIGRNKRIPKFDGYNDFNLVFNMEMNPKMMVV